MTQQNGGVKKALVLLGATGLTLVALWWSLREFGASSVGFAFLVVWLPMAWLGTVGRVALPRLPARFHALRGFERDGRVYNMLGVPIFKKLLRRGPLAVFNPDLHLPKEPTPERLAHLDQRIRDAEASHFILFALTLGVVVNAIWHGWWLAAVWTLVFDVLLNGYPVMLQRFNRALLASRFADTWDPTTNVGTNLPAH